MERNRRRWTNEDIRKLIYLWETIRSVALISRIMDRPPSSIQTQASRRSLPKRTDISPRNRRRWTKSEDDRMRAVLDEHLGPNGELPIIEVAAKLGRSVDAIVSRVIENFGPQSHYLEKIIVPEIPEKTPSRPKPAAGDMSVERKCISCGRLFISPNRRLVWKCAPCKSVAQDDYLCEYL